MKRKAKTHDSPYFLRAISPDHNLQTVVMNCGLYAWGESPEELLRQCGRLEELIMLAQHQVGMRWAIVERYRDHKPRAGTPKHLGLKQMIHDIENGRINTVVVTSLESLTASVNDAHNLLMTLQSHAVSLLLFDDPTFELARVLSRR